MGQHEGCVLTALRKFLLPSLGATVLIALGAVVFSVWWHNEFDLLTNADCDGLSRLVVGDAPFKAASDFKRGDPHLIGIRGYAFELPGVPGASQIRFR